MPKFLTTSQWFWTGIVIVAVSSFGAGWTVQGWKRDAKELALMKELDKAIDVAVTRQTKIDRLSAETSQDKEAKVRIVYRKFLGEVKGATTNTGCLNTTGGSVWNRALQGRSDREADSGTPAKDPGGADSAPGEGR